jgi:hypothetical protein
MFTLIKNYTQIPRWLPLALPGMNRSDPGACMTRKNGPFSAGGPYFLQVPGESLVIAGKRMYCKPKKYSLVNIYIQHPLDQQPSPTAILAVRVHVYSSFSTRV